MRWPLRYQILVPFAGVMLAVVAAVSLLDAVLAARRSQRQIERQLSDVALTLQEATFPLTDAVLRQTRGLSGAEFVLTDGQQRVLASSDPLLSQAPQAATDSKADASTEFRLGPVVEIEDRQYSHSSVAIVARGGSHSPRQLHIYYPAENLRLARWEAAYPPLVVGTLLLVVVAVLAFAIAGRLSRPILELRRQLGRLVQGDFQPVPLPVRNDELRDLVHSANLLGEQLAELRTAIKRSERLALLGQLSGGLAHQLRNTITGARMAVQLHRRACGAADDESLEVALRQLSMTETHLQRFLTAGQPAAPRLADCDLHDLIADVAALVAPACTHRQIELRLPEPLGPLPLVADPELVRQLLVNLLMNAMEAAGQGGWVAVDVHRHDEDWLLTISDSGPGPGAELAARLFEPFVTGKPEGIGLGLTVVRQIVDAHGGTIQLRSHSPTCFEVSLPATPHVRRQPTTTAPAIAVPHP